MTHTTQKGFTLVEMLVVLGIFSIMTSIVIFNYNKFRSDTILTNMAYEVALSIREAQIYGVSVRAGGSGAEPFNKAYGIHLEKGKGTYSLFIDGSNNNGILNGVCPNGPQLDDVCITPYAMQRKVIVSNITGTLSTNNNCISNIDSINLVFRRPNLEPTIKRNPGNDNFSQTEIMIQSPGENTKRYINVYANGQIAVLTTKQLSCSIN